MFSMSRRPWNAWSTKDSQSSGGAEGAAQASPQVSGTPSSVFIRQDSRCGARLQRSSAVDHVMAGPRDVVPFAGPRPFSRPITGGGTAVDGGMSRHRLLFAKDVGFELLGQHVHVRLFQQAKVVARHRHALHAVRREGFPAVGARRDGQIEAWNVV